MQNKRGFALGFVVIAGVVGAIAACGILIFAMSRARHTRWTIERPQARYAAEAGLVWAMQRLYEDPTWSSPAVWTGPPNDPPQIAGTKVDIIIPACTAAPCEPRTLQAKVVY